MKKNHQENTVGPWAAAKLDALESYLEFYGLALSKQPFKRIYIDAFAGASHIKVRGSDVISEPDAFFNRPEDSEAQGQFLIGSPLRALGIKHKFHQHYFFDIDETRVETLRKVTASSPNVYVQVGDCNPFIQKMASSLKSPKIRGVAFLDPYGAHLEWETLKSLAATGTMEVVVNFPVAMAINRLITKSGIIPENWSDQLTRCFGTEEWRELAYANELNLFGDPITKKHGDVSERLLGLYLRRMKEIFPHVAPPRLIRNTRNAPLYYLIWAGPNKLGLKVAEYVLSQGEKIPIQR